MMEPMLGIFDSGLGGLTVVGEIKKKYPDLGVVYLGDTARVPYGPRGVEVVRRFASEDANFLIQQGVEAIVIACNTVSAIAADEVRRLVNVPVFEMVSPAAREAMRISKTKKIGVIGTRGTIGSHAYAKSMQGCEVYEQECPLLVPFVEEGEFDGEVISSLLKRYLRFVKEKQVDTLILGCTHYPLLLESIVREVGTEVQIVNCGVEVAKLVGDIKLGGRDKYFLTDLTVRNQELAEFIMGGRITIEKAEL